MQKDHFSDLVPPLGAAIGYNERTRLRILELIPGQTRRLGAALELAAIRRELRRQFAATRGWKVAQTVFDLAALRKGTNPPRWRILEEAPEDAINCPLSLLDHLDCFRQPDRPYKPVAMITHPYGEPGGLIGYAAAMGLEVEVLPWSWWYPGKTTAVLLTRPAP